MLNGLSIRKFEKEIEDIKRYRRRFYDNRSQVYDEILLRDNMSKPEMDGFKHLVKIKKGEIVLDIATGTGIYLLEMAKDGALCYGIDISPKMLSQLKLKIKQRGLEDRIKEIRVGEADALPYQDSFFDLVTCIGMLEYYPLEYAEIVLTEIRRVLKPNRRCFIDVVDPYNKENQSRDYLYKYNLGSLEDVVRKIGFTILEKNTAGRMIQYLLLNAEEI